MREFAPRKTPARASGSVPRAAPVQRFARTTAAAGAHDFGAVAVHDAAERGIRTPAGPLPFLDRIQQSFGLHDVTGTRAHVGPAAADASRRAGANAFTSGEDVAFGETPTLRLAAHEAAHVIQQRHGVALHGGIGHRGDPYERQADEAAERVAQGRSSADLFPFANLRAFHRPGAVVQRDEPAPKVPASVPAKVPAAGPASAPAVAAPVVPLGYNRTTYKLSSPDPAWTEAAIEVHLKRTLKSFTVTGVTAAMPPETRLYLLYALSLLEGPDKWGQETDVIAPISRSAKAGVPDPVGRVTVRIDTVGNAEVELVAAGPVPVSTATTVATATPLLKADPGFLSVRDDTTATWSDAEIADVVDAIAMLPAADRSALKGVELIRVKSIAGGFAGEFSTGGGVAAGAIAVTSLPYLALADKAFDNPGQGFYGGAKRTVPASFEVILHEVGHAVEKENLRTAVEALDTAQIAVNKKLVPVNDAATKYKKLTDEYAKKYPLYAAEGDATKKAALAADLKAIKVKEAAELKKYEAAKPKFEKAVSARDAKTLAYKATKVDAAVVTPLVTETATKKTDAGTALTAARGVVSALAPALVAVSKPFADAIDATAAAIDTFTTAASAANADIGALEATVIGQVAARNAARLALGVLQVLCLDIGTDILPAVALGAEPSSQRALAQPPLGRHLVDRALLVRSLLVLGLTESAVEMIAFLVTLSSEGWRPGAPFPSGAPLLMASGAAFTSVVAGQMANAFACRSATISPRHLGWFSNPYLVAAVLCEAAMLAAFLYVPFLSTLLGQAPPSKMGYLIAAMAIPAVLAADAIHKRHRARTRRR